MSKVACIGECMIEMSEHTDGRITRAFGGDTLNTAVYLARLGVDVDYITALGDDRWSTEMLAAWQAEGVGTAHVVRMTGRVPGLYVIQTDASGERHFTYWRDRAPAREIFAGPHAPAFMRALPAYTHLYVSGISLSLYGKAGRECLATALETARASGARIVFDTNFRARGWPDLDEARAAYRAMFRHADIVFASTQDLQPVFGDGEAALRLEAPRAECVLKHATPACTIMAGGETTLVAAAPIANVVDTTAAGDSFAAGYLAARIAGKSPVDSARVGHRVAGSVVQHRGAIIPRDAMPKDVLS